MKPKKCIHDIKEICEFDHEICPFEEPKKGCCRYEEEKMVKINPLTKKPYIKVKRKCSNCGAQVFKTDVKNYPYVCLKCDENKYSIETEKVLNGWKTIGFVGVDSGSLMIGDPCYLDGADDWNESMYDKWICGDLCESGDTQAVEINEMCLNQAVAFSSGFGDGVYEVKALYKDYGTKGRKDIRIKEVKIILITDEQKNIFKRLKGE